MPHEPHLSITMTTTATTAPRKRVHLAAHSPASTTPPAVRTSAKEYA
ncbi:hypothetical protein [Streptomyces sp. NPDC014676]